MFALTLVFSPICNIWNRLVNLLYSKCFCSYKIFSYFGSFTLVFKIFWAMAKLLGFWQAWHIFQDWNAQNILEHNFIRPLTVNRTVVIARASMPLWDCIANVTDVQGSKILMAVATVVNTIYLNLTLLALCGLLFVRSTFALLVPRRIIPEFLKGLWSDMKVVEKVLRTLGIGYCSVMAAYMLLIFSVTAMGECTVWCKKV